VNSDDSFEKAVRICTKHIMMFLERHGPRPENSPVIVMAKHIVNELD
jgi:hypothetical protein